MDLNLIRPLLAILEERNVTRAAERLHLSQPATSASLARLRRHFNDELLTRSGRLYELTPFAQTLLPMVEEAVQRVNAAMEIRSGFDPTSSERSFEIAASDYSAVMLIEPLRRILSREAPNVSVDFVPIGPEHIDLSSLNRVDLLVGPMGYSFPGRSRQLFRDSFVAVLDEANPVLDEEVVTLTRLAELPHAVGYFGESITTPADRMLESFGFSHLATAQVRGLLALPMLVQGTDLVALVPRMLALRSMRSARLAMLDFPVEVEAVLVEAMYWHPVRDDDPATLWLRDVLKRSSQDLHKTHAEMLVPVRTVTIDAADTT